MKLFALCFLFLSPLALADAHSDGLSYGSSQISSMNSNATSISTSSVPLYTTTSSQSSIYTTGGLATAGASTISSCSTQTSSSSYSDQACNAVNYISNYSDNHVKSPVSTTDSVVTSASDTIKNASTTAVTTSGCTTATTTTPSEYATNVCNVNYLSSSQQCTEGMIVDVNANMRYACDINYADVTTYNCNKILTVTLVNNCQNNPYGPAVDIPRPGGEDVDHIWAQGICLDSGSTNGNVKFTVSAYGLNGGNYGVIFYVPQDVSTMTTTTTVAGKIGHWVGTLNPNWLSQVANVQLYVLNDSVGCGVGTLGQCNYHFYWEWVKGDDVECSNDKWGTCGYVPPYVYKSNSNWILAYYGAIIETDTWTDGCTSLEAKVSSTTSK